MKTSWVQTVFLVLLGALFYPPLAVAQASNAQPADFTLQRNFYLQDDDAFIRRGVRINALSLSEYFPYYRRQALIQNFRQARQVSGEALQREFYPLADEAQICSCLLPTLFNWSGEEIMPAVKKAKKKIAELKEQLQNLMRNLPHQHIIRLNRYEAIVLYGADNSAGERQYQVPFIGKVEIEQGQPRRYYQFTISF